MRVRGSSDREGAPPRWRRFECSERKTREQMFTTEDTEITESKYRMTSLLVIEGRILVSADRGGCRFGGMIGGSHRREEGITTKGAKSAKKRRRMGSRQKGIGDFHKEDRRFRRGNYNRTADSNFRDSARRARRKAADQRQFGHALEFGSLRI
jgi:hypothetical protein